MLISLCARKGANTGAIGCDVARGIITKLFIFNGSAEPADYPDSTTLLALLAANAKLSKFDSQKVFPIPESQDIADASEANTEGTLGLGFKAIIREGKPAYTIKIFAGNTLAKQLRKFNNSTVRILEYDSNKNLWGTQSGDNYQGYQAKLFFTSPKGATGAGVEEGVITMTLSILDVTEYADNAVYIPIEGNINDIAGLFDVDLKEAAAHVSNAYKVKALIPTSQINAPYDVYPDYSADLADIDMWQAHTGAGFGTPLAITSAVVDASLKAWTITFDNTAFTALPAGAKIKLEWMAPEVLAADDVTGVESNPVILTK